MDVYIIPVLLVLLFLVTLLKKIPAYDTFVEGAKQALSLCASLFPFLVAVFLAVQLFRVSGAAAWLSDFLSPVFSLMGIPKELVELILIRPLSGGAGLSLLSDIFTLYGPDSYVSRCACVVMGSSETIFYIAAVYFSGTEIKKLRLAIPISLVASLFGNILGCLLLRFM